MIRTLTADERDAIQSALDEVKAAQTVHWEALGDLEALLNGVELDGNTDYQSYEVDTLLGIEDEDDAADRDECRDHVRVGDIEDVSACPVHGRVKGDSEC